MGQKKTLSSILLLTGSFLGGVAAGFLLAPKSGSRNRVWLRQRANDLSNWMNKQGKSAQIKGKYELHKLRNNVQQGIRQHVPNPYSATDHINLSDRDIVRE